MYHARGRACVVVIVDDGDDDGDGDGDAFRARLRPPLFGGLELGAWGAISQGSSLYVVKPCLQDTTLWLRLSKHSV